MEHKGKSWFDIDKDGLRDMLSSRRGPEYAIYELLANAWDEPGVTTVTVTIAPGPMTTLVSIEDDAPKGWEDVMDAYVVFATSKKKGNPLQRGRFNLGEKLAICLAQGATVETTKGRLTFRENGERTWQPATTRERGTKITLVLLWTPKEIKALEQALGRVLPPPGITTVFNGTPLTRPPEIRTLDVALTTEVDHRPTTRKTTVTLLAPVGTEQAWLFELGIPICQTDFPCHVDIGQKVPLTIDRETVRPAFLKDIGAVLLNGAFDLLTAEQATQPWCREAAGRSDCSAEATRHLTKLRFGDKVVAYDPSDPEANMRATAAGYTVVAGGSLSKGEWQNVKKSETFKPAGHSFGTAVPFATNGTGKPLPEIPQDKWTPAMAALEAYVRFVGESLLGRLIKVKLVNHRGWATPDGKRRVRACYGDGELILNLAYLIPPGDDGTGLHAVLLHEFAHEFSHNHLSDEYHEGLAKLGAKLTKLALTDRQRVAQVAALAG